MTEQEDAVELKDNFGFPYAVAPKGDVPNLVDLAAKKIGRHGFGIDPMNSAAALRLLADQIEAGVAFPQEMVDAAKATVGEFVLRTLTFTFTFGVKREPEA